jgi:hypothetical protein
MADCKCKHSTRTVGQILLKRLFRQSDSVPAGIMRLIDGFDKGPSQMAIL